MVTYIETLDFGRVRVIKRRGSRSMRIAVSQTGEVRLSIPYRISTEDGIKFLNEKKNWINKHKSEPTYLEDGAQIGNNHTLKILVSKNSKTTSKIIGNQIIVNMPEDTMIDDVQKKLEQISKKLLKNEAESVLPQKIKSLANEHGYKIRDVSIKPLQSRWGSCSTEGDIVLNSFLMQLPYDLVTYVMFHELAHTKHHNHGDGFWDEVKKNIPDYKNKKVLLKKYPTKIFDMRESARFVS